MNIEQIEPRLFGDTLPGDKTGYQTYLKPVFPGKHICALWANIAQVIFLCSVVSMLTYWDNIDETIFQCNVFPAWPTRQCVRVVSNLLILVSPAGTTTVCTRENFFKI